MAKMKSQDIEVEGIEDFDDLIANKSSFMFCNRRLVYIGLKENTCCPTMPEKCHAGIYKEGDTPMIEFFSNNPKKGFESHIDYIKDKEYEGIIKILEAIE